MTPMGHSTRKNARDIFNFMTFQAHIRNQEVQLINFARVSIRSGRSIAHRETSTLLDYCH